MKKTVFHVSGVMSHTLEGELVVAVSPRHEDILSSPPLRTQTASKSKIFPSDGGGGGGGGGAGAGRAANELRPSRAPLSRRAALCRSEPTQSPEEML